MVVLFVLVILVMWFISANIIYKKYKAVKMLSLLEKLCGVLDIIGIITLLPIFDVKIGFVLILLSFVFSVCIWFKDINKEIDKQNIKYDKYFKEKQDEIKHYDGYAKRVIEEIKKENSEEEKNEGE